MSYIKPLLHHLNTEALAVKDNDTTLTKDNKERIKSSLTDKYCDKDEINMLLDVVTTLDPHFKADYMSASDMENVKERIMDEALNEEQVCALLMPQSPEDSGEITDTDQTSENDPPAKRRKLFELLNKSRSKDSMFPGNENSSLSLFVKWRSISKPLSLTLMTV